MNHHLALHISTQREFERLQSIFPTIVNNRHNNCGPKLYTKDFTTATYLFDEMRAHNKTTNCSKNLRIYTDRQVKYP